MNILNERVEHIKFGSGVITEVKENKVWVKFEDEIGTKAFLYPEVFKEYLKAVNPTVENNVLEEWHRKQEQMEMDREEKELAAAKIAEEMAKLETIKKKTATKATRKKS